MVFRFFFGFVLCFVIELSSFAGEPVIPSAEHIESVRKMIQVAQIDDSILHSIRRSIVSNNSRNPDEMIDVDVYLSFVSSERIGERVAPIYAQYISKSYADKMLISLQTPMGKLSAKLARVEADSGYDEVKKLFSKMSQNERRALSEYRRSPVFLSLLNAENRAQAESNQMLRHWISDGAKSRMQQVRNALSDMIELDIRTNYESETQDISETFKRIPKTGVRHLDQEAQISYENIRNSVRLNQRYVNDFHKLDINSVLLPVNLTSRKALEDGILAILATEALFDAQSKAFESLNDEYQRKLDAIPMPAITRQDLRVSNARNMAEKFDIQIRQAESVRSMIEVQKRILELCSNEFGKIKLKDDRLVFDSRETLDAYNLLVAQANAAREGIRNSDKEENDRRQKIADRIRSSRQ